MEAKHTPGPWKQGEYVIWPAHGGDAQFPIHARKRGRIALALTKPADARLIATAPELLEELTNLRDQIKAFVEREGEADFYIGKANAVIAKALGHI